MAGAGAGGEGEGSSNRYPYGIETIVVLVMENRSFDHMLGWMKSDVNPHIDGVSSTTQFSNPLDTSDPDAGLVYFGDQSGHVDPDPDHTFQAIYEQVFGEVWSSESAAKKLAPSMQGFAQNAAHTKDGLVNTVMNGLKPELLPVYKDLVSQFAVCDRWFSSLPGPTQPNRLFVHSATSHGLVGNPTEVLIEGLPQNTIFESLRNEGYSFGIYYQYPASTLLFKQLRHLKYLKHFHQFDIEFKSHCKKGKLPNYVVIEQRFFDIKNLPANDDHPHHDIYQGQKFVKEVYEALRSSPQWNNMLFIVVYDEHGGFYDHVPTPVDGVPNPDGLVGPAPYNFNFDRLGVRVPAILVSPRIDPGTVLHEANGPYPTSQFEHSSIPATVKKMFNLKQFLNNRDAWAATLEGVLTRETPRTDCPITLSEAVRTGTEEADEERELSDLQKELVQLAACLKGDHKLDSYPHDLVAHMKVKHAVDYVNRAFWVFKWRLYLNSLVSCFTCSNDE